MNINSLGSTFTLFARMFDRRNPTEPIIEWRSEKPDLSSLPASEPLPYCPPEEVGVPSDVLASFLTDIKNDPTLEMHGILIVKDGRIICPAEFGAHTLDTPKYVFSASKSVTALAIGMLIGEGKLSQDERITDIFPDEAGAIAKLKLRDVTVKTLLTMRSCVSFNEAESMTTEKWTEGFLSSVVRGVINTDFNYNSLNTYMLAAIVKKKTGEGLVGYLTPRLFEPLGIKGIFWEKSPEGIEKGGWGLYIRPADFAKIGMLVMNGGVWNGKRLLPAGWINEAISVQAVPPAECGEFNYGYQIWVGRRANTFLFNGMLGQNVLCFRSNGIIIVSNAGNEESFQQSTYFGHAMKYFGQSFEKTLPRDAEAEKRLDAVLASLRVPAFAPKREKPNFISRLFIKRKDKKSDFGLLPFCGMTLEQDDETAPSAALMPVMLQAVENNYSKGFCSISFDKCDDGISVKFVESDETYVFTAGENRYISSTLCFHGQYYTVSSAIRAGKNEDGEDVITLSVLFPETPFRRMIKIVFGGIVNARFDEHPGRVFSTESIREMVDDFARRPIIGQAISKADKDFLYFKVDAMFEKTIRLKRKG